MNLLENQYDYDFTNEAEKTFAKDWPSTFEKYIDQDWSLCYHVEDLKTVFEDGFLAGILWFKGLLDGYEGERSELQIRARNDMIAKSENMISENQLAFDFGKVNV